MIYTKVTPEALMATAASTDNLALVGDGEDSFIFRKFLPAMDGLFTTAKIIELLASHGTSLVDLVRSLDSYHISRSKVPCHWEEKGKVIRLLAEQYHDSNFEQSDGVKTHLGQEWCSCSRTSTVRWFTLSPSRTRTTAPESSWRSMLR